MGVNGSGDCCNQQCQTQTLEQLRVQEKERAQCYMMVAWLGLWDLEFRGLGLGLRA